MSALGDLIRQTRQAQGLSQAELAKLAGFKDSYIAKIERGRERGSYFALLKIVKALEIPVNVVSTEFGINDHDRPHQFTPEDYRFSRLSPKVKQLLLELSTILQRRV